jgi:DNA-binding CsgD family transcriptional regulator
MTESIVDRLYEAAVVPELWSDVLVTLSERLGARGSAVIVARGTDFVRIATSSPEITELATDYQVRYPNNQRIVRLVGSDHAGFLQDISLLRPGEVHLDESYEEYLIPKGFGAGAATVIDAPSGDNLIVHSEFKYTGNPISADIIARLNGLRPHFARAALLSSRLSMERAQGMADALKWIGLPAAVLRQNGTILAGNESLQALIPSVMQDRRERVTLTNTAADQMLSAAIAQYQTMGNFSEPASIPVAAAESRLPAIIHLIPVRGAAHDIFNQSAMLLVVTPVDRALVPSAKMLQGLFDLTPAEARVARGISEAQTVEAIALSAGVSPETIRSQLKAVLAKTGLSRQQELISLLAGKALFDNS